VDIEQAMCLNPATVAFWDSYADWYRLWIDHTHYHDRIIDFLTGTVEPGWKVLDIGSGSGVLSMPLCAIGCDVTALEPSEGMRRLLHEKAYEHEIWKIGVDERRLDDIPLCENFKGYDLVMACNSLHLTGMGFEAGLERIFQASPKRVLAVTEIHEDFGFNTQRQDYTLHVDDRYTTESSFAYHTMDEAPAHLTFKKGRTLTWQDEFAMRSTLTLDKNHLWEKDAAVVGMFLWQKNTIQG